MVFFVSSEVQTTSLLLHSNAVNLSITLCRSCRVPGLSWPIASYNPPDSMGLSMASPLSRTWPSCRALQQVTSERRATAEDRHENHPQRVAWRRSRRSSRRKEQKDAKNTLNTLRTLSTLSISRKTSNIPTQTIPNLRLLHESSGFLGPLCSKQLKKWG